MEGITNKLWVALQAGFKDHNFVKDVDEEQFLFYSMAPNDNLEHIFWITVEAA